MKLWLKRIAAAALIIAGIVLFWKHTAKLLDWPHLYPDYTQIHLENLLFLGLTLLAAALAWISAAYLLLNADQKLLRLLLPAAAFVLFLTAGGFCLTRTVGEIPCTYTTSLEVCKQEFRSNAFQVQGQSLYPPFASGEITSYARYQKGEVLAESLTRTFDRDGFYVEQRRLEQLCLEGFHPEEKPTARETVCYELSVDETLWQVLVDPWNKTVVYSRFYAADQLPSFAPHPTEPPAEPTA